MSPEIKNNLISKEKDPSERKLELERHYDHETLKNGDKLSLHPDIKSMGIIAKEGVYQDLMMVIKAGDDFFSVVDVFIANQDKNKNIRTTVLTHHAVGDESRAEFVSFIHAGSEPIVVGRADVNGYSDTTSRRHFEISKSCEDRHLEISDTSTNGTEIFCSVNEKPDDNLGPLEKDSSFWSIKTAQLKDIAEQAFL